MTFILLVGFLGVLVTVFLHAVLTSILISALKYYGQRARARFGIRIRPFLLAAVACALAFKHAFDIFLWAIIFQSFAGPEFDDFETAVYFSSVTYTTLGYGDVVVMGSWRMLCSIEAIDGMILFGLSTAMLFALVERLWLRPEDEQARVLRQ